MKLITTIVSLLLSSFAASTSLPFSGSQQVVLSGEEVPGENPLKYCQETKGYSLDIKYVDLDPNPPKPGKQLTIEAKGNFTEKVEKGAYVNVVVKYGFIRLISSTADLCEQMESIDEECPLEGDKTITKNVDLPAQIPPGKYTVLADVYSEGGEKITCLEAEVHF